MLSETEFLFSRGVQIDCWYVLVVRNVRVHVHVFLSNVPQTLAPTMIVAIGNLLITMHFATIELHLFFI